jgi:hypothetical protein
VLTTGGEGCSDEAEEALLTRGVIASAPAYIRRAGAAALFDRRTLARGSVMLGRTWAVACAGGRDKPLGRGLEGRLVFS